MNKKGELSASMMCASMDKIFYYLTEFKECNVEYLHIDIMDGEFVPNLALGTDFVKSLRRLTDITFDYHFLVKHPEEKMKWFDISKDDHVAFHFESTQSIDECIKYIKSKGAKVFIAINPETSFFALDQYLDRIDGILVMSVYPGFAGKPIVPFIFDKMKDLKRHLIDLNYNQIVLEVDGNMTIENAKQMYEYGADIFVSGSSSLFSKSEISIDKIISKKRKAIGW